MNRGICKSNHTQFKAKTAHRITAKNRLFLLGPCSILAALTAIAAVAFRLEGIRTGNPGVKSTKDRAIPDHELGSVGANSLMRVPSPSKPLLKPEIDQLILNRSELHLTTNQIVAVGRLTQSWHREKNELESALNSVTRTTALAVNYRQYDVNRQGTLIQFVERGMGAYSELSREYNRRREAYWTLGLAALNRSQCLKAIALPPAALGRTRK